MVHVHVRSVVLVQLEIWGASCDFRLAGADVVLTTYNIVSREVPIPDQLKDKHAVDMPATDATLVCVCVCLIQFFLFFSGGQHSDFRLQPYRYT